jgi:hypothetical protein
MKFFFLSIIICLISFSNTGYSQLNLNFSYEGYYDDNIFNNYEQNDDFINSYSLSSAFDIESEFNNVQIYYEGNLSTFQTNQFKNSNSHRFGIVETHLFSIDDNPLNAGINYSLRNNKDEFKIYDFNQLSAYINYRQCILEHNYLLAGYIFNKNNFKNFSLFSYYEHKGFLRWISNIADKTSLIASSEFDYKDYLQKYNVIDFANEASLLKLGLSIAKIIGENTRVSIYSEYRKSLTDKSRYMFSEEFIYYEEEIFNDIYSTDGITIGGAINQYLIDEILISVEARYLTRNFNSLPVADLDGYSLNELRDDKQYAIGVAAEIDMSFLIDGMSIETSWNHIKNNSNDYFYDYSNNLISVSVTFGF